MESQPELHDSYARDIAGDLSIGGLIGDSWSLIKEHTVETVGGFLLAMGVVYGLQAVITIGIYALMLGGMLAFTLAVEVVGESVATVFAVIGGVFGYSIFLTLIVVVQGLAFAAYQAMWLKLVRGESRKMDFAGFFRAFALPLTLGSLLQLCAAMVGSLALLIGAYVVMLGLFFMPFLVFDWGLTARQALSASWKLSSGYKLNLLVLMLALCGVNMLGMVTCGAGMLVTLPLSVGTFALFYDRIARPGNVYLDIRAK